MKRENPALIHLDVIDHEIQDYTKARLEYVGFNQGFRRKRLWILFFVQKLQFA
ncbi:hypothetical protein [Peribacillus butanolivorans]|uniref:hypothetical protein n=1 Tax=Peribacillus butanolivorans TaxID=421767 RepID=UPI0036497B8F